MGRQMRLTGGLTGKTISLGSQGFPFSNGMLTLVGGDEDTGRLAEFLWRNWQAVEVVAVRPAVQLPGIRYVASAEVDDAIKAQDSRRIVELTSAEREEMPPQPVDVPRTADQRLQAAILALDPDNDEHWTAKGMPAMSAIEPLYGASNITRADVQAAVPGYCRAVALANRPAPPQADTQEQGAE